MTESLEALKSAQDGRLPKDKLQDDALAKLTKGNSHLHRQLVNVQTTCESASSKMDVMIEHMVDLSTRTEKNAKQAEDSRVKSVFLERQLSCVLICFRLLVQDVVSQLVPQIVHQVVNRAGQQYHPQS